MIIILMTGFLEGIAREVVELRSRRADVAVMAFGHGEELAPSHVKPAVEGLRVRGPIRTRGRNQGDQRLSIGARQRL